MPTDLNGAAIAAIVIGAFIVVLHILTCLYEGKIMRILSYFNILLHIGFFILAFFGGFNFELIVCCFMASALIYSLLSYITYKRSAEKSEEVSERDL